MAEKTFSIYPSGIDRVFKNSDSLVVEIGLLHIACLVKRGEKNVIVAFELFDYSSAEANDFNQLFISVMLESQLLDKSYASTHLFINNPYSVLIPYTLFNKEIALDYLNISHGIPANCRMEFDRIDVEPAVMNAYRVEKEWLEVANRHLITVTKQHAFTKQLAVLFQRDEDLTLNLIKAQFYKGLFTVTVLKQKQLQLVQTYVYDNDDDVLYYLLSAVTTNNMEIGSVMLEISGLIGLPSSLYSRLTQYFKNIQQETIDDARLLINASQYPKHYFTPFYNLAL